MKYAASPFAQLLQPGLPPRLPHTASVKVVVDGRPVTDVRQVVREDEPEEQARLRERVRRSKKAAKHKARMLKPEQKAKRAAWYEANREKVAAYQREYRVRNKARQRALKTAWAKRTYTDKAEQYRASQKAYYYRNRETILARLKAKREAAKAAKAANAGKAAMAAGAKP